MRTSSMVWATLVQGRPLSPWGFCPRASANEWNLAFSLTTSLNHFCWPWLLRDYLCDPSSCLGTQPFLPFFCLPISPFAVNASSLVIYFVLWTTNLSLRLEGSSLERRRGQDCSTLLGRSSLSPNHLLHQFPTLLYWSALHTFSRSSLLVASQLTDRRWAFYDVGP